MSQLAVWWLAAGAVTRPVELPPLLSWPVGPMAACCVDAHVQPVLRQQAVEVVMMSVHGWC